jgi:hypothetical protein
MLSPYVNNISAYDAYGNPLWDSGAMPMSGAGQTVQMLNQYDAKLTGQLGSQLVDPQTGQLIRQPTTPGEAAAAADAMEQFYQRQTNQQNQAIMNMLGGGQNFSSYGQTQGGQNYTGYGAASDRMTTNPYGQAVSATTGIAPGGSPGSLASIGVGANGQPLQGLGSAQIGANGSIGAFSPAQSNGPLMGGTRPMASSGAGAGGASYGGSFGSAMSGGGVGGPGGFRPMFEQELYKSMTNPGLSEGAVNSIINQGTEEIASGERNSLNQLQDHAAGANITGGGAQSGANREVLSDFAGKRANLARDVRVQAELSKQNEKLGAMRSASDYFGKLDDNARADRNQLIQFLMSNRGGGGSSGGNQSPFQQFSGLMSQAGQNGGLAYNTMAGGTTGRINPTPTTQVAWPGGSGNGLDPKPSSNTSPLESRWGSPELQGQQAIVGFSSKGGSNSIDATKPQSRSKSFSSLMR